jgi:tight adherence protein C
LTVSPPMIAALAALGITLVFAGQIVGRTRRDPVAKRLADLSFERHTLQELELQQPFSERVLRPLIRGLAGALGRVQARRAADKSASAKQDGVEAIRLKLALAGNPYRWTPADYLGTKIFAALLLGGILFFLLSISGHTGYSFIFGGVGAGFGWFGPDLLLRSKRQARQKAIQQSLPDALDLLVISVEAGLGFDAAIQRLVDKRSDALALELARVLAEMRVGRSRRDALRDMAQRTGVPDLTNFVGAILQADQLGVSVTKVLMVQAEQMRVLRRQRAEEKAAQLQLKMIFPLAIFIFPALCIVIIGPIWPTMAATGAPGV